MAFNEREQQVIEWGKANGKSPDEISEAVFRLRTGQPPASVKTSNAPSILEKIKGSGTVQRLSDVGNAAGEDISNAIQGEGEFQGQSPLARGVQAVATASSVPVQGAVALAPKPVRQGIEKVGQIVGEGFKMLTDKIAGTELFKGAAGNLIVNTDGTVDFQPNDLSSVEEPLKVASGGGEISGNVLGAQGTVSTLNKGVQFYDTALQASKRRIDDAAAELAPVGASGAQGIQIAEQLGLAPENIMQRVARVSKGKQAKFEEMSNGESIGKYLVNRNIFGTPDQIVDQLYERMKQSKDTLDQSLANIPGEFKAPQVKTALDQLIERDTSVSTPGALSPDSNRITQLWKKYNQQGLTISEVNEVKRLYERNVRVDYLTVGAQAKGLAQATNIDSALRNLVEDKASKAGVETVRQLNKETQLARQLVDDIGAEYAGQAGNNAIGLTDAIFLAESFGNPVAAVAFGVKKGLGNRAVMSSIAKMMSPDAGSKEKLPDVGKPTKEQLTGYLKFLDKKKIDNFERDTSLSPANSAIEAKAFKKIIQHESDLLQKYKAENGKIINTDNFRKLFTAEGYKGSNAASVQEPSSYLSKKAFTEALKNPEPVVSFTAGGSGTGKSSALKGIESISNELDNSAAVLDSNLSNYSSAIKKINEALDAGKEVVVDYVYRDPLDSFENGVVKRMLTNESEGGRLVPSKVVAGNHIDSLDVAIRLQNEGIPVRFVDNSLGAGNAKISTAEAIQKKANYPSKEELTERFNEIAKRLLEAGKITKEQYAGYIE
jgi:hypothetical protein